jgi:hypothetical protein
LSKENTFFVFFGSHILILTYFFFIRRSNSVLPKLSNVPLADSVGSLSAGTGDAKRKRILWMKYFFYLP